MVCRRVSRYVYMTLQLLPLFFTASFFHSCLFIRYMYHVLTKNTTVTDHNRNLLVETIRSITEILIWGDQNDSSVFE